MLMSLKWGFFNDHALVPLYSQTLPKLFGRSSFARQFPACGPKIGKYINIYNPTVLM